MKATNRSLMGQAELAHSWRGRGDGSACTGRSRAAAYGFAKKAAILGLGILSAITVTIPGASGEALAGSRVTRATCNLTAGGARMGKMMGQRNAARLVQAAWHRLGRSCDQLDRLAQMIADTPLQQQRRGGVFAGCFYMGYVDSLWEELDNIYMQCGEVCFNAGTEIGRISAEGYCAASIALGGLFDPGFISQPPLPFCGQNLVMGCKAEYVSVATYEFQGCYDYTTGYFAETFDNSVRQDCFVPEDVPIRTSAVSAWGNDWM